MLHKLFRVQKLFANHLDKDLLLYTIEELSELIHSLCKYKKLLREMDKETFSEQEKEKFTKLHLIPYSYKIMDDMADVEICLKQLEYWLVNQKIVGSLEELNKILRCSEEEKIQSFALKTYDVQKAHKIMRLYKKELKRNEVKKK